MFDLKHYLCSSFGVDLRSLGITRIMFAFLILVDLFIRSQYLQDHYTGTGLLPLSALLEHYWKIGYVSVHILNDSYLYQCFLFVVSAFSALMLLIGWKTRFFTIVSWFLLASLNTRNPFILQAGDVLFRCLLFWAIFMPWGDRFSVDSFYKDNKPGSSRVLSAGAAAFMVQIFYMYFFTAIFKSSPVWNESYQAVYFALSMEQFSWMLGPYVYQFPQVMEVLTFWVYWAELLGPFLFFVPFKNSLFRFLGIALFLSLQTGLLLTMWLGLFPFISIASLLIFIPGTFWKRFGRVEILLDGFYKRIYNLNLRSVFRKGRIPPLNVNVLGKLSGIKTAFVVILLVYAGYWNLTTIDSNDRLEIPNGMNWIARLFRIDQKWNMFAPHPATNDGWFIVEGVTENGHKVDLLNNSKNSVYEKPGNYKDQFRNYRWRKYMRNMLIKKNEKYYPYFGDYLCRKRELYNSDNRLVSVELHYMMEKSLPGYKTEDIRQQFIFRHKCDG